MTRALHRLLLATDVAIALSCSPWSLSAAAPAVDTDRPHATAPDVVVVPHLADAAIVTVRSRGPVPSSLSAHGTWTVAAIVAPAARDRDTGTSHPHAPLYARLRVFRL